MDRRQRINRGLAALCTARTAALRTGRDGANEGQAEDGAIRTTLGEKYTRTERHEC